MEKTKNLSRKNIDMTEGPLFGKILMFVLPMMAANLLQCAYNAADMMVVGLSHEANAVGAIGLTGAFINLVLNVFVGFAIGANVAIARHLGAKNGDMASKVVHTSLVLALVLGVAGGALGISITRPVLSLMGAEENLLDLATTYTYIYFIGAPFLALTNYSIAIFRAKGDTRTPLYVLTACGLLNVGLNVLFVLGFHMSVEGVAIATMISNLASAILLIFYLSKGDDDCKFRFKLLRIDKRALSDVVKIGFPAGIQGALFSFSNMLIQSSILRVNNILAPGSSYEPVVEANAAVSNLNGFIYTATNSVSQASVAFTSQNVGAGKYDRVKKVMYNCYALTGIVALVLSFFLLLFNKPLLALYGISDGEGLAKVAYDAAMVKIKYETLMYFLLSIMEVGCGVIRGLGKSLTSTIVTLIGACLLRVVWILTIFERFQTLPSIYLSYPVSWFMTGAIAFVIVFVVLKRKINETAKIESEPQEV